MLFLIAIYPPKNDNRLPSEIRNEHHSSNFTIAEVFPGLGSILMTGLIYGLYYFTTHDPTIHDPTMHDSYINYPN